MVLRLAIVGAIAAVAVAAQGLSESSFEALFSSTLSALMVAAVLAGTLGFAILKPLWRGPGMALVARTACLGHFLLLALGVASYALLRLLGQEGFPIAATQRFPVVDSVVSAIWIVLFAGMCLIVGAVGALLLRSVGQPSHGELDSSKEVPSFGSLQAEDEWDRLRSVLPLLAGVGLLGAGIITAATGQVALFSSDIDDVRYRQAAGLGFAALLQYELLLAACIAGIALALSPRRRITSATFLVGCVGALTMFRVERTPVVFVAIAVLLGVLLAGRVVPRRVAVGGSLAVVALVSSLGILRYVSASEVSDRRELIVRPIYDIAPEFREQAFAFQIYPDLRPHLGSQALAATATSVVPGRLLSLVGVDKSEIYTDVSRDYSATMRQLGYYSSDVPLRVGLAGELWIDFGPWGMVVGMLAFGGLVGTISWASPRTPLQLVRVSIIGALALLLLITPLGSALPIALMVLTPLVMLKPLKVNSSLPLPVTKAKAGIGR